MHAYSRFFRIGLNCITDIDATLFKMQVSLLGEDDVLFVISSSGRTENVVEAARLAKKNNVTVVALSDFAISPLSKTSDYILYTTSRNANLFLDIDMPLITGQITIIDMLYMCCTVAMVSLSYSTSTETRERIVVDDEGEESTEEIELVILTITMTQKTADEMAAQYGFTQTQQDQLHELLSPDYADLWAALIGGSIAGGGEILIGNPGYVPTGIFSWPLAGDYPVNSGFGYRADPFDPSQTVFHGGVDMRCPEGTPILAAADGTVVVANATDSWGGSWGYYVKIQHDGTYHTLYAHCSSIAVTNGQQVQKGQVIGYVGSTGNSSGNHLHFEVYLNGARVNPLDFFG